MGEIGNVPLFFIFIINRVIQLIILILSPIIKRIKWRLVKWIISLILMIPLITPLIALVVITAALTLIERTLNAINVLLNMYFLKEKKDLEKKKEWEGFLKFMQMVSPRSTVDDIYKEYIKPIHFIALFGLILLAIGFTVKLV